MGLARALLLRGSESPWLRERLAGRRFVKRAVRRFMPGEELIDAVEAARRLGERDLRSILTLLGENVDSAEAARQVAGAYDAAVSRIEETGLDADLSVKPTHLGLDLAEELARENLDGLIATAGRAGRLVAIDMEGSAYVDRTLQLYRRLRATHANVGICLQAYLHRTEADLESLLPLRPMVRLVKGAYKEPRSIAYPKKSEVDRSYVRLAGRLLEARIGDPGVRIAFGTHDERMIRAILARAEELGLATAGFEVQMLYGIRRDLQEELTARGVPVRVLVSYGPYWFPWYMRRLAERPANVGFVLRSAIRS